MRKSLPNEQRIRSLLAPDTPIKVFVYDTVESTNKEAKRYCLDENPRPALFVARGQSLGRGRLGRSFDSMRDKGLYMTLAFKPYAKASPHSLTLTAGCAVLFAIRELTGVTPKIKWVNDIIIDQRKIAGILAEGAFSADGNMSYAIVGIGVNIKKRAFQKELEAKAGTLEEQAKSTPDINALAAEITNRFFALAKDFDATIEAYRTHLDTLGRRILVTGKESDFSCIAKGLDDTGNLIIERDDGSEDKLFFGEISVINQY